MGTAFGKVRILKEVKAGKEGDRPACCLQVVALDPTMNLEVARSVNLVLVKHQGFWPVSHPPVYYI